MTSATNKNRMREFFPTNWTEFDSLLGQVFGPNAGRVATAAYSPAGVWQDDAAYYLELDLPGVARDDVDLTLEKDVLKIVAERQTARRRTQGDSTRNALTAKSPVRLRSPNPSILKASVPS